MKIILRNRPAKRQTHCDIKLCSMTEPPIFENKHLKGVSRGLLPSPKYRNFPFLTLLSSVWKGLRAFFALQFSFALPQIEKTEILDNLWNKWITLPHTAFWSKLGLKLKFLFQWVSHMLISCWGCHKCLFNSCMQVSLYIILEKKLC